ncbi:two-component system sensor histidine kinase CreC [Pseudoxanthomonas koreensis]|uniref:two-component system sensor histidine kinase CreC n=1 Tax=Pseudoxanthomonas koreensis TaxID=266061 RepID=UPI0013908838|nr:two-component system sensor histidine kinase CreC [Pseudoxanthomonas koreensis]KAF1691438.1 two-component system sensor histidine kinase CreC [Pseudoxanthomonas koreensis]
MRLGLRLFLGFFLIVGLAAFFVMRVFVDEVKPGVRQAMESTLVDTANVLAAMAAGDLKAGRIADGRFAADLARVRRRDPQASIWDFPKRSIEYRVTITDVRGIVVFDSEGRDLGRDNSRWNDVYRTLRGEYGARSSPEAPGSERTVMHVAAPVLDPDAPGILLGVLTVAKPNHSLEPFIQASQRSILRQGAWLVGLSALVGLLMTGWLMRGIGRLNRYAQAVAAGEPVPPPPSRRDEIGDLGRALEDMRRKLEGKAYVEQYVQSLTHEMKSPLAAIRGAAELLQEPLPEAERQRFAGSIREQQARLTETIDKLLALAEVEQHGWLQRREPVDLAALLRDAAAALEPRLAADGLQLQIEGTAGQATVRGDAFLLRQALANLLDNALAFSPPGGTVVLGLDVEGDRARLRVRDSGPGVPEYAATRVFERFYSLPRPGNGQRSSGLGLPFVREVARLHGGEAWLRNHEAGGAEAGLSLPL